MQDFDVTVKESRKKIMLIDSKSFYASVESVLLGLNPMKSLLVVMSQQASTNGGLVLAASPRAKSELGEKNVMRQRELPKDPRLIIVNPRMNFYIAMNKKVNDIFRQYVAKEDLQLYSIDESILDATPSWDYLKVKFGSDLTMKKLARIIQLHVKRELGLYLIVGIGDTIAMAKMALDIESKHKNTGVISLYVGFSYASSVNSKHSGFSAQMSISSTNRSQPIVQALWQIFDSHYNGEFVRNLGVSAGKISTDGHEQMDLFIVPEKQVETSILERTIDEIRSKYGMTSLVKLSSIGNGGTMIQRAGLIGGHNGGNAYG